MSARIANTAPFTGPELAAELRRLTVEVASFYDDFELDPLFTAQVPGKWSPAGHLRHLTRVNRAIARGLQLPNALLLLRFGPNFGRPSRAFHDLVEDYRRVVGGGAGRFAPPSGDPLVEREAYRERIFGEWRDVQRELASAIDRWSEKQLDRTRLPHPLMGKLTAREMLMFAAYHIVHHASIVEARSIGSVPPAEAG